MRGTGYTLSNMNTVYYVDAHYPHAIVDENGNWYADDDPDYGPIIGPRHAHQVAIVFSCDQKYFPGLMPAFLSLQEYHPDIPLVIIDRGLSPQQVRYLQQFAEVYPSSNHLTHIEAWGRFEVSFLHYDRVVFMDSDIIFLREIPDFLETNAEFAAVKNLDWGVRENFKDLRVLEKYNIDPDTPAFFAGGFSIDNRIWGNGKLFHEAMKVYKEVGWSFLYADQSALQIIMHSNGGRVTFLGDEYNAIAECWDWGNRGDIARIIHYAGDEIKPWDPRCKYPKSDLFFKYSKIRRV